MDEVKLARLGYKLTKNRYAFTIGCNKSSRIQQPLMYAENDATQIADLLQNEKYKVHSSINKSVADTINELKFFLKQINRDDLFFLFVSCHGERDGDQSKLELRDGPLLLSDLHNIVVSCPARRKVLIFDACKIGLDLNKKIAKGGPNINFITDYYGSGCGIFYSCRAKEVSFEDQQLGHGVFTSFIINALKSKTKSIHPNCHITLLSLVAYANQEMIKYYTDGKTEFVVPTLKYEGFADIVLSEDFNVQESTTSIEEVQQFVDYYEDFTNYKKYY